MKQGVAVCSRRDSNPRPLAPEASALSAELQELNTQHVLLCCVRYQYNT